MLTESPSARLKIPPAAQDCSRRMALGWWSAHVHHLPASQTWKHLIRDLYSRTRSHSKKLAFANPSAWIKEQRHPLTIQRLKGFTVIAPPLLIGAFEFIRHDWSPAQFLPIWAGNLVEMAFVMLGTFLFSRFVFGIIESITRENERRRQEAEALFDVGTKITSLLDSERVLQSIVEQSRRLLTTDVASITLVENGNKQSVRVVATSGMSVEELQAMRERMGRALPAEEAILTGQPSCDVLSSQCDGDVRCRLAVPLIVGHRVIGSLCVGSRAQQKFSPDEIRLLARLANQAAIAIENARLQAQAQQLATLEERDRIARELHDGLGQTLNYLALKMDVIDDHLQKDRTHQAQAELVRIRKTTRDAAADVRESILGLRTTLADGEDWVSALQYYLAQYGELNAIGTEWVAESELRIPLPPNAQLQLLRVVQEALANVRKHAAARKVRVRVDASSRHTAESRSENTRRDGASVEAHQTRLRISVEDNGCGFDPDCAKAARGAHFGLAIMRERVHLLGGELRIESQSERGTRVIIELPTGSGNGTATYSDRG